MILVVPKGGVLREDGAARWGRAFRARCSWARGWMVFTLTLLTARLDAANAFDAAHSEWTTLLSRVVRNGLVDYTRLQSEVRSLDRYLASLSAVEPGTFKGWDESSQIAFLCNAYNAFTLKLVLDHKPRQSIKEIGGPFRSPWKLPVVRLFGEALSLDALEHENLRKRYQEPRIHFALVCAAMGCPPLREEAYVGSRLDRQLSDQARRFLAQSSKHRIDWDMRLVYISPIFKWFEEDFVKTSGSVWAAIRPYWPEGAKPAAFEKFEIRYSEYDWSLNRFIP